MDIVKKAIAVRDSLKKEMEYSENEIDIKNGIVSPYEGKGDIRLIIVGQDPTIRNAKKRVDINTTLNLDKQSGSLFKYIERICLGLEISIDNVYATNVYKYFYTRPPADTIDVLIRHLGPNLELLNCEISKYPDAIIVTLGEPVLQLLTNKKSKVRNYWGYKKGICSLEFSKVLSISSKIKRDFYPLPHQPSLRKSFYKEHLSEYLNYIKRDLVI